MNHESMNHEDLVSKDNPTHDSRFTFHDSIFVTNLPSLNKTVTQLCYAKGNMIAKPEYTKPSEEEVEEKASWFKQNLRKVVGWSYILADSIMGVQAVSHGMGISAEIKALEGKGDPLNLIPLLKQKQSAKGLSDNDFLESLRNERTGDFGEVLGMAKWAAGGAVMARYGNRSIEEETLALESKLGAYLLSYNANLKGEILEKALKEKHKPVLKKVEDFAYQYPSEIMHACFAAGAVDLIKSGLGDYQRDGEFGTLGMGICVLGGALAGLLVKEKTKEELAKLEPAKTAGEKISRWAQRNANTMTSGLYLANNAFSGRKLFEDYSKYNNPQHTKSYDASRAGRAIFSNNYMLRAGALGTYIFGAGTLGLTSKESGHDKHDLADSQRILMQETAAIIAAQTPEQQELLIKATAEYLSHRRELGFSRLTPAQIEKKITGKLAELAPQAKAEASPPTGWVNRHEQQEAMAALMAEDTPQR